MRGHILAASDGGAAANGALRLARLLEERVGTGVEVVTVWEPISVIGIGTGEIVASAHLEWETLGAAAQRKRVLEQLAEMEEQTRPAQASRESSILA
jgi:hypothetical protein